MVERIPEDELIRAYKDKLRRYLEIRPSGLRKKISDEIGTNRSFVSQITNPRYSVPIPSHYIHKIMDICHLSAVERSEFISAYLAAHPGQAELIGNQSISESDKFKIDLSAVSDMQQREIIKHTLKNMAETLIALANGGTAKK